MIRRRVMRTSVKNIAAIIIISSLIIPIFNAGGLYTWASRMKAGPARNFMLMLVEPLKSFASSLSLDAPGREIRKKFHEIAGLEEDAGFQNASENEAVQSEMQNIRIDIPDEHSSLIKDSVFSEARPLKVIFIGDSMIAGAIYGMFTREVFGDKAISPSIKSRHSSGLTRQDYFNWQKEAESIFSKEKYDCVVVLLGTNDAQDMPAGGKSYPFNSYEWLATYKTRAISFISYLNGSVPEVYWIGLPRMRTPVFDASMRILNGIYESACSRFKRVRFIPTAEPLGDKAGNYTDSVVIGNRVEYFRSQDGIHLLFPAGKIISGLLLGNIRRDFKFAGENKS